MSGNLRDVPDFVRERPEELLVTGVPAPIVARALIGSPRSPTILLAASLRWPIAARLGMAFAALGCRVEVVCPPGHPATKAAAIDRIHGYSQLRPLETLRSAIVACEPDLVVPCDDNAALQLCALHTEVCRIGASGNRVRSRIVESLGVPDAYVRVAQRGPMAALATELGVRTPATCVITTRGDLQHWLERYGFPAVLKLDATWGGQGVVIVHSYAQACRAFAMMRSRPPFLRSLARAILDRDPHPLLRVASRHRPSITLQQFIEGVPANRAVACWHGRVVAGTSVEAIRTQHETGPPTVVRIVHKPEMASAAERLIRSLGVSGLWGFDFIVETRTGDAYLIEINPRATPICHFAIGAERSLPLALYSELTARPPRALPVAIVAQVIAMFPGEWQRDSTSPYLRVAYHDVPWHEAQLVRDGIDGPWAERGLAARLWAHRRRRAPLARAPCEGTSLPASGTHRGARQEPSVRDDAALGSGEAAQAVGDRADARIGAAAADRPH